MKRADIIAGILGIAFAAYVLVATASFPEDQVIRVGPAFFPRLLAFSLLAFSLLLLVSAFFKSYTEKSDEVRISWRDKGLQRAAVSLVATILVCIGLEYLGFFVCSITYLLFLMFLLKDRNYLQMVLTSIIVTAAVFLIFRSFLNITLPLGTLYGF